MLKNKIQKVLILGSGGLRIGQAGEFDYAGSQALKALKQEGVKTVLVNPNIATVQTDPGMADQVYLQPLNIRTVTEIIKKERPDGILLGFGGQTALNLGLALESAGVLKKYSVAVLGTPVSAIRLTEDRDLFKKELRAIDVKTPRSCAVTTTQAALAAAEKIGYPIMLRSGFSLGGLGSGQITNAVELAERATESLHNAPQILIEEYLTGWKEIEYEVVRDANDTTLTICNMENMDPMGIHTGESIVVAPSQTLTNQEYHLLREVTIRVARKIGILGEGNVQFALNPANGDYRVIEMNARLSRSSALASKATGYPLAFVAAKIALGKKLTEIPNAVTKKTTAAFEPALDYVVVKIPRWDLTKFKINNRKIGTEMKSVGEVMAIGRSFPEALQKGLRMLNIGANGITDYPTTIADYRQEIEQATDRRVFAIYEGLKQGLTVAEVCALSKIDAWFVNHINTILETAKQISRGTLTPALLRTSKQMGFSDKAIGRLKNTSTEIIRQKRLQAGIRPVIKQIDTLAGEFPAETNYLYLTYHGQKNDVAPSSWQRRGRKFSAPTTDGQPLIILGSGPYCIGSSVEFDWCAVNTARTLRALKESTIIINSNPETVSTDYDESDRLYFEELTLERVQDIADFEQTKGIIVSVGGQIANNLAIPLSKAGYHLLGTSASSIDQAEDRKKFSTLLNQLKIDQPAWAEVTSLAKARAFADQVGYPILVRPSYVLSGAAMNVIANAEELAEYLNQATLLSDDHPVVISQFILNAKELEIDGVAQNGEIVIDAISEHVENAGVHSGDATIVLPPQRLYLGTIRKAKSITREIVRALKITGPFNIQFLGRDNELKVIECNLRASRSFPFVSKVTTHNFIALATQALLGKLPAQTHFETLELGYVGVKTPQFSYQRVKGADPVTRVEMASTGEVGCLGRTYHEAFVTSWLGTEQDVRGKRLLLSIGGDKKIKLLEQIKMLAKKGWILYATDGTHDLLAQNGLMSTWVAKTHEAAEPNVRTLLTNKMVDLIINIPSNGGSDQTTSGFALRRLATDHHIPLVTNVHLAQLFLRCLSELDFNELPVISWQEYTRCISFN